MNVVERDRTPGAAYARRKVSGFARSLLAEWKRLALPVKDERIVVAVSGGADSVALLLTFDELVKAKRLALGVTVAHLDHGLRGEAGEEDARWVAELAREIGYEIELGRAHVKQRAIESRDNLEQAARRALYEFLAETAEKCKACAVLTAHTMDDQAETVMLRLLRGSGAEGLSGIEPVRALIANRDVLLVRPLLGWARRAETESYCRERNVRFRVDEMNTDERFMRVRVRRQLLPLMQAFNERIVEALSRTSELLREDAMALSSAAEKLLEEASEEDVTNGPRLLRVDVLFDAPAALRRRALRQWIERGRGDLRRLEMAHLLAVDGLLRGERGGRVVELPGGATVSRRRGRLRLQIKRVEKGHAAV